MKAPKLTAYPREDFPKGWKVFCVYCKKFHLHGETLGHRTAHCDNDDSPYNETGYVLVRK